jgi:plasmid stability protein
MPSLIVRNIEESLKARLKLRAAGHGRSMEEEARQILRAALARDEAGGPTLAEAIRKRFAPFGGADLPAIEREPAREPPPFAQ